MTKFIQLKFLKIEYSGDSIGDDIQVNIEVLDRFFSIDKIIEADATAEINQEVGRFETDLKFFESNVKITVIEKDLLFNDVGFIEVSIKIDTSIIKPQQFFYEIKLKEYRSILGKFSGKNIAIFKVILEANILDMVKYVSNENDGWLKVRLENNKSTISLSAYLKVKVERIDSKREYFTILEGVYRWKLASVKFKEDGSSYFISGIEHKTMDRVLYSISNKTLTLNNKTYTAVDYPNFIWEKGLYDIEIPDMPHSGGLRYVEAKRAKTWFRVGHTGDRYLHTGRRSLGCITIVEIARWMEIYDILIKARKGDFVSVGVLEVID